MQKKPPTSAQAEAMIERIVAETREKLLPFMRADFAGSAGEFSVAKTFGQPPEPPDLAAATLRGYCGHAQYIADCALEAAGLSPHWLTIQKPPQGEALAAHIGIASVTPAYAQLGGKVAHNHVALTVAVQTSAGEKTYLVEPTFRQFCTEAPFCPGMFLGQSAEGDYMLARLRDQGVLELNEARAKSYLSAFCNGLDPLTPERGAMVFLTQTADLRQQRGPFPPQSHLEAYLPELRREEAAASPAKASSSFTAPRR